MTDAASLAVEEIVAGYGGVQVLDHVSVSARTGTITAVLGANGAGKTTLLRAISGFVRPRHGRVLVGGTDLARRHPEDIARAGVSHVPEGQGVITELTVEENLRVGALARRDRAGRAAGLNDAYQRFPMLAERRRRAAGTLSGGERQILVIARALMAAPRVLLLDEPSLGLSPRLVSDLFSVLRRLTEGGQSIVLVEQNAHQSLKLADHIYVLENGRIASAGTPAEMRQDKMIQKAYLGL